MMALACQPGTTRESDCSPCANAQKSWAVHVKSRRPQEEERVCEPVSRCQKNKKQRRKEESHAALTDSDRR